VPACVPPTAPAASPAPTNTDDRRCRGAFFTVGNPFTVQAFSAWLAGTDPAAVVVEPFAGAAALPRLMAEAGHVRTWAMYDIAPAADGVVANDSLRSFPPGFAVCITNPPYLSAHVARRRRLDVDMDIFDGYASLYQTALDRCLASCAHVAAIVPESLITSGMFRDRLSDVVSLPGPMFTETTMPVCLALFGPDPVPASRLWLWDELLGDVGNLCAPPAERPCGSRVRFNVVDGQIGLRACDSDSGPTIAFCEPAEIPADRVNAASRLITRIAVDRLATDAQSLIAAANAELARWRTATGDAALTPFCGSRSDGRYRRRLDYGSARALLAAALCALEGHTDDHDPGVTAARCAGPPVR
jgi:hypothetical protein